MTNKEYIEKNNISFSEAMKMWDNKTTCINDWLNQEHQEHKFKVGDIVVLQIDRIMKIHGHTEWMHNAVMKVVKIVGNINYAMEFLTPDGDDHIGCIRDLNIEFIDNCCIPY